MIVKKDHFEIIVEDFHAKLDSVIEVIVPMQKDVAQLKSDMTEVKADIKLIKGVLKVNSADIAELKAKAHVH